MEDILIDYWNISLANGLFLFIFASLLLIYILINKDSDIPVIKTFYNSIENENTILLILKQILIIIIFFFNSSCTVLTSYYLEPCFILISYQFSKFIK